MIRISTFSAICLCATLPVAVSAQEVTEVQQTLSFGTTFATFEEDDGGESGHQFFAPLQFTYSTPRWDIGIKTALINSERDSDFEGGSGSVSTLTDTVLSGSYRAYAGTPDWSQGRRVTFSLNADVNLPTGQSQLTGSEKNAIFSNFIVDQDRFGEGLNVGIGFSGTLAVTERTLLGVGLSYIGRGDYNPDGDLTDQELDPGNQVVGSFQVLRTSENFEVNAGYRFIFEEETDVNGDAIYDRANSHELFLSGAYQIDDLWVVRGSALYATRSADELLNPVTGQLEEADEDDTGDTYYLSLGVGRQLTSRDQIGVDLSYRRQAKNDFDEQNFSFEPNLTRRELSVSYGRMIREGLVANGSVAYFEVEEGDILGFKGPKFTGAQFSLGAQYEF